MSQENHFNKPIENCSFKNETESVPKLSFIDKKTENMEDDDNPPDRTYNLCVVIKLAFMAAMGGFLFGYFFFLNKQF